MRIEHETRSYIWRGAFFALVLELMLIPAVLYWPQFSVNIGKLRAMTPLPVLKQLVGTLESGGVFRAVSAMHQGLG